MQRMYLPRPKGIPSGKGSSNPKDSPKESFGPLERSPLDLWGGLESSSPCDGHVSGGQLLVLSPPAPSQSRGPSDNSRPVNFSGQYGKGVVHADYSVESGLIKRKLTRVILFA